jgi:DnaJ family protein C protein 7
MSNSAMNSNSMDVDPQPVNGAASPPPPPTKASSNPSAQKNFAVPIPNGNMAPNGNSSNDEAPTPPPHKSNPSSPIPTPIEDAESYKTAGNRLFKEKNYPKAIEQYSKGMRKYMMNLDITFIQFFCYSCFFCFFVTIARIKKRN